MHRRRNLTIRILACTTVWSGVLVASVSAEDGSSNWPAWRGPLATGEAPEARPPVRWSESEHVRWRAEIPGLGHSTPLVWDDRIFVTTAVPIGDPLEPRPSQAPGAHDNLPVTHRQRFELLALRRSDGQLMWRKSLHEALPHEGGHYTGSLASASPVTDGQHVYAFFGSFGLYCLDFEGNLVWQRDLGRMDSKHGHGEGSSPVLSGETLVLNWDHEGQSFVLALDKATGETRWKKNREEVTSWATPVVVEVDGRRQVVVSGTSRVRGYELETGEVVWECGGLSANIVASPVFADGVLYAGSSYEKRALLAIRLAQAQGDVTHSDHVLWRRFRGTPYVPSPLLYDEHLYFLTHYQGILTRVHAESGEDAPGAMRLGSIRNVYASPVAADGRIYVTDLEGTTVVIDSREPRILAVNHLRDNFAASAAIAGNELYLRGTRYLYCLSDE